MTMVSVIDKGEIQVQLDRFAILSLLPRKKRWIERSPTSRKPLQNLALRTMVPSYLRALGTMVPSYRTMVPSYYSTLAALCRAASSPATRSVSESLRISSGLGEAMILSVKISCRATIVMS